MKLFIKTIIASVFVSGFTPVVSADNGQIQSCLVGALKPKVTICFTVARKRDCEGFGICNLNASISDARLNNVVATVYKDDFSNALVFEIDRSKGVTAAAYDRYFKLGTFTMEDDTPVPYDLARDLGISTNATLMQGRYAVVESGGILRMTISFR